MFFDNWIAYSCFTDLFEIELFICIKMDLALNNLRWLICHKTQTNKQTNIYLSISSWSYLSLSIIRYWSIDWPPCLGATHAYRYSCNDFNPHNVLTRYNEKKKKKRKKKKRQPIVSRSWNTSFFAQRPVVGCQLILNRTTFTRVTALKI